MRRRVAGAVAAALLAACAGRPPLTSSLDAAAPKAPSRSYVGEQAVALAATRAEPVAREVLARLEERQSADEWAVPARLQRRPDGSVAVRLDAGQSFEPGSGQLRASALGTYASIASALRDNASVVVHVLVVEAAPPPAGPADALSARRADSLLEYFERRGLAATRLRAEGRSGMQHGAIELIVKPVVQGRESEAWLAPAGA